MRAFLYHWLWLDLWTPIWPNLAASAVTTVPLIVWHHKRTMRKMDRQHKAHLSEIRQARVILHRRAVGSSEERVEGERS